MTTSQGLGQERGELSKGNITQWPTQARKSGFSAYPKHFHSLLNTQLRVQHRLSQHPRPPGKLQAETERD